MKASHKVAIFAVAVLGLGFGLWWSRNRTRFGRASDAVINDIVSDTASEAGFAPTIKPEKGEPSQPDLRAPETYTPKPAFAEFARSAERVTTTIARTDVQPSRDAGVRAVTNALPVAVNLSTSARVSRFGVR